METMENNQNEDKPYRYTVFVPDRISGLTYEEMLECYMERKITILVMHQAGFSTRSLAKHFQLSESGVSRIIREMKGKKISSRYTSWRKSWNGGQPPRLKNQ